MKYITHELSIDLPNDEPQDLTMNILAFNERGTNLVIGRGFITDNETLQNSVDNQLKTLRQKGCVCGDLNKVFIGKNENIIAYEVNIDLIQNNIPTHQLQVNVQIPDTNRTLAISYTKYQQPFTEQDKAHWQEIKNNFDFNDVTH